jgi:membrane-associated phospholipid phosphatase
VTFATATVIERHLGWRKSLLGMGIASYVAMSRIHDNRHYLSDVIFGAAVGSIAGRTVVTPRVRLIGPSRRWRCPVGALR